MCNHNNCSWGSSQTVNSRTDLRKQLLSTISDISSKVSEIEDAILVYEVEGGVAIKSFGNIQETTNLSMLALESNLRQLVSRLENTDSADEMLYYIYLNATLSRVGDLLREIGQEANQKLRNKQ